MAEHHWGWLVAIYLFLGGMGAGSFLIASLVELSGQRYKHKYCPTTMVGAGVSGPLILIGTVLLILDLGAGLREPWRIPLMFTNFSSVMTWGIWILSLFMPHRLPLRNLGGHARAPRGPGLAAWPDAAALPS